MIRNIAFITAFLMLSISVSASPLSDLEISKMKPPESIHDVPVLQPIYLPNTGGSIINTAATATNDVAMQPIHDYRDQLAQLGDTYLATKNLAAAERAGLYLTTWAKADALTGPEEQHSESDVNRYMFLSSTAMNYLKIKPALSAEDQQIIEKWLLNLAMRNRESSIYLKSTGNLRSWHALGILATGIAANRKDLIDDAREKYTIGTSLINDDGTIDTELARQHRALIYTDGATIPLVLMAELSRKIHEDWYEINPGRIDLTPARILYGVKHPEWFAQRAGGAEQELVKPGCWLIFFAMRHPENQEAQEALKEKWGDYQSRIGGSTTVLAESHFFEPN
ncbi:hypothetical protein BOO88_19470 [Stutzerimonas stutzeri]|nr:hypothetical protein BOO88_19470 [Stutzerimonas stutzeri]